MNILKLFKIQPEEEHRFGQLFDAISSLTEQMNENELKRLTATAGLFSRLAYADTQITPDEIEKIKFILLKDSSLPAETIGVILTLIVEKKVELLTLEEHFYIRLANESMSANEKSTLIEKLFQIAAADGVIQLEEENQIYNLANQFGIPRNEIVELKRKFKDYLSVFQTKN